MTEIGQLGVKNSIGGGVCRSRSFMPGRFDNR